MVLNTEIQFCQQEIYCSVSTVINFTTVLTTNDSPTRLGNVDPSLHRVTQQTCFNIFDSGRERGQFQRKTQFCLELQSKLFECWIDWEMAFKVCYTLRYLLCSRQVHNLTGHVIMLHKAQ